MLGKNAGRICKAPKKNYLGRYLKNLVKVWKKNISRKMEAVGGNSLLPYACHCVRQKLID